MSTSPSTDVKTVKPSGFILLQDSGPPVLESEISFCWPILFGHDGKWSNPWNSFSYLKYFRVEGGDILSLFLLLGNVVQILDLLSKTSFLYFLDFEWERRDYKVKTESKSVPSRKILRNVHWDLWFCLNH